MRKTGVSSSEDYISLSVTRRTEDQGPHPESRLVREEDELGEGDDGKPGPSFPQWRILDLSSRICRVHQRTGTHCSW